MVSIGFRASPEAVHYAVVASEEDAHLVRTVSSVVMPLALHLPEQLAFLRTTLLDIIGEYGADCAGIRTTEPIVTPHVVRTSIEGVIQELLASGAVARYCAGPIATIRRLLQVEPAGAVLEYIKGEQEYPGTTQWHTYKPEQREAILIAMAALQVRVPRYVPLLAAEAPPL
jgi:hypothetical protein